MPRVKRGTIAHKRREKILKKTKGFKWGRKSKERAAKEALIHAGVHAFRGRKEKKRTNRGIWHVRINAALRTGEEPISYSAFMKMLKDKNVALNRKVLADMADKRPEAFAEVVAMARK
jgi:large subunit ribosomal protein L20